MKCMSQSIYYQEKLTGSATANNRLCKACLPANKRTHLLGRDWLLPKAWGRSKARVSCRNHRVQGFTTNSSGKQVMHLAGGVCHSWAWRVRQPPDHMQKAQICYATACYTLARVTGLRPPGCPKSSVNDVALRDCQNCHINRPCTNAQDRLLGRDKSCPASSYLIMSRKALLLLLSLLARDTNMCLHIGAKRCIQYLLCW